MEGAGAIVLKVTVTYVYLLIVLRLTGRRAIKATTPFDLLVALMLGEVVDEIIYGDVRFLQGAVAVVAIAALAYTDAWLAYWDHGLESILEGKPTVIVRDGEFVEKGMRAERMNEKDVLGQLRSHGIHDMREVHIAVVEHDGSVSVIKHSWADAAQKADVLEDEAKERDKVLGDQETPPPHKRTDSLRALDAA